MAKSPKSPPRKKRTPAKPKPKTTPKLTDAVIEAKVVDEVVATEAVDAAQDSPVAEQAKDATSRDKAPEAEDAPADTPADADTAPRDAATDAPSPYMAQEGRSGGLVPTVLGGVIAGAIGFGAALLIFPEGWREKDDTLVTSLQASLAEQQESLSGLTDQIGDLSGRFEVDISALRDDLAEKATAVGALGERLENLTKGDGSVALPEDVQLLLNAQKEQISALTADVAEMAAAAKERIAAATQQQETAEQAEARVKARGALQVIRLALVSGEPFADALVDVAPATDVPAGLQAVAADGAPTAAELQAQYPVAARAALAKAIREDAGDDTSSRLKLFLQDQLGARSLTPQEGDDADAVLSRAEAAVKADDLATALQEIDALSDVAKAEFADWQADAKLRMDAVSGFEAVSDALNGN